MKIRQAFKNAYGALKSRKGETLKFLALEAALTGMCLAPLLFLTEKGFWRYLAVLAVPMWLGIKVPARLNAAAALGDCAEGGPLFSLGLASTENYGKKVLYGLRQLALLLVWAAPLIAALVYAYDKYAGDTDGLTVMSMIHSFGGGDMKTGVIYLLLILAGTVLLAFAGMGFHSGDRYARAAGQKGLLKGKRPKVLLCRICSLVCLLPLIIAAALTAMRYMPLLNDVSGVLSGDVSLPDTRTSLIILGIGAVLTVPLIPLRSMITAAYVRGLKG